jgi:hypothetical protein
MRYTILIALVAAIVWMSSCKPEWDEHYNSYPELVNDTLWNAMKRDSSLSKFVQLLEDAELDSLLRQTDVSHTVLIPGNAAIEAYTDALDTVLLQYHICTHVINSSSIVEQRSVQMLSTKFANFDRIGNFVYIDGVGVISESPLYLNGRYFVVEEVIRPKPNLYQFFKDTNSVLSDFIDNQDSVFFDEYNSKPIGYDEDENTIYDSVFTELNLFEMNYFPVKREDRDYAATIVFPYKQDYHAALNTMADNLGSSFTDYTSIPEAWQNKVLIPYLINKGIFANRLEPDEFLQISHDVPLEKENILGEFVEIDYSPANKEVCSNGYAYSYRNFEVPEFLYAGKQRIEGEFLSDQIGTNKYVWAENVNVQSPSDILPFQDYINSASNDSVLKVEFRAGYSGEFSIEFFTEELFPRDYVVEFRTNMDIGGVYEIWVNDVLERTFDYNEFIVNQGFIYSEVPEVDPAYYLPNGRYNSFDIKVESQVEYGPAKIRINYIGPGNAPSNGLLIDYIEFKPATN